MDEDFRLLARLKVFVVENHVYGVQIHGKISRTFPVKLKSTFGGSYVDSQ